MPRAVAAESEAIELVPAVDSMFGSIAALLLPCAVPSTKPDAEPTVASKVQTPPPFEDFAATSAAPAATAAAVASAASCFLAATAFVVADIVLGARAAVVTAGADAAAVTAVTAVAALAAAAAAAV